MAVKFDKVSDSEYSLDVTGYTCPHPQMYTKKALEKMASGDVLTLIFDNPSSGESIISMLESAGHELFDRNEGSGSFTWQIRKG
jgi:tRNA 2-thiouridine synthesizing protein A